MRRPIGALALVVGLALAHAEGGRAQRGSTPVPGRDDSQQGGRDQRPAARTPAGRAPEAAPGPGQRSATPERVDRTPVGADDGRAGIRVPEGKLKQWFGIVDTDGNGWLSLRETAAGFGFDAGRFRAFDLDKDGRMTLAEYGEFYVRELEAGNGPAEPRATPPSRPASPRRDPLQLRVAFDRDLDGTIDVREFGALLAEYDQGDVDARMVFLRADSNGDQRLDLTELTKVAVLLDPLAQNQNREAPPMARTLSELFGQRSERGSEGRPPFIAGPVPVFWRLDIDGDGTIEDEDLAVLQGHIHLPISVPAVKSALDRDGDGRLSALEFAMALDPNVRPESPAPAR